MEKMNKEKKVIEILKKYFYFKFISNDNIFNIQAWSYLDTWDTSAYELIEDKEEIELLKEVFCCEKK